LARALQGLSDPHSETRTRINYQCGPFKHTLSYSVKISSFGLELWEERQRNPTSSENCQ